MRLSKRTTLLVAPALAALLAGCGEKSAAIAVPDPAPPAYLAAANPLPYAEPAPVSWYGPDRGYQWAERAYGMQRAFHEAPPDYGFQHDGVEPWVWETEDQWAMYAEPWDDGYRYYYYEPGAAYPYFVRDDDYGYGYDAAGVLVALFDADGDYLPQARFYEAAPRAGRYYTRGRDLRNSARQARRVRVDETIWVQRAPRIVETTRPWLAAGERDDGWRDWRERRGDHERRRFVREERRREAFRTAAFAREPRYEDRRVERRETRSYEQAVQRAAREDRRDERRVERERREAQFEHQARRDQAKAQRQAERQAQAAERHGRRDAQAQHPARWAEERGRKEARRAAPVRRDEARVERQARAAEPRGGREAARAAEQQARDAAFRGRGEGRPDHGGGHADRGGGKPDRGNGERKGGGKKD